MNKINDNFTMVKHIKLEVRKFAFLSDDELYMLKRCMIESSFNIFCAKDYSTEEKTLHSRLSDNIIDEIRLRRGE